MKYFLDTNALIDILNSNENVRQNVAVHSYDVISVPDIAYYEVMRGFETKPDVQKQAAFKHFCNVFGIVYQTRQSLEIAAKNYALLRKAGTPVEDGDLLIGSLAIAENAILVTNNIKHLSRLQGIQLENWAV